MHLYLDRHFPSWFVSKPFVRTTAAEPLPGVLGSHKQVIYHFSTTKVFARYITDLYLTKKFVVKYCTIAIYCSHSFLLHEVFDITSDMIKHSPLQHTVHP